MTKEQAVDELAAVLNDPDVFMALVDLLEPSPIVTMLRLWGVVHGVYPPKPLAAPDVRQMAEYVNRLVATGR